MDLNILARVDTILVQNLGQAHPITGVHSYEVSAKIKFASGWIYSQSSQVFARRCGKHDFGSFAAQGLWQPRRSADQTQLNSFQLIVEQLDKHVMSRPDIAAKYIKRGISVPFGAGSGAEEKSLSLI
jgi:hypothetical protein